MVTEDRITKVVESTYRRALYTVHPDTIDAIESAYKKETGTIAKEAYLIVLENMRLAKRKKMPICQDTGLPQFFVKYGSDFRMRGNFEEAVRRSIANLSKSYPLLPFVVHPLTRENTMNNVGKRIPIFHYSLLPGANYLELTAVIGPAQPQSFSCLKMFPPTAPVSDIKNFIIEAVCNITGAVCPPLIVGVGIGGLFDSVTVVAKEAALRPLRIRNEDPAVAKLEGELLEVINRLGIGHMALGGATTALAVNIEISHTHAPCLPVAIQLQCWCNRYATARIYSNGKVEEVE
jgi:tartrate/fumarate subfamily iron-sulfur-dependent hydro-lyase alpha chain